MKIRFYEYAACSTCKKARKWLESRKLAFETVAMVEHPPTARELLSWIRKSGIEPRKFFNTSGQVYRERKMGEKLGSMTVEQMADELAANGKLIKRPLLVAGEIVLVGFDEKAYARVLRA